MALETELEVLKSVVNKLDSSLEKISEVSNSIGKLLAVHDERMKSGAAISTQQHNTIRDEIQVDIKDMELRVTSLEKWKWYIMGAGMAIGYLLGDFLPMLK